MSSLNLKGFLLTSTVITGVMFASPAFAQETPPASTSPSNTTSESPTSPVNQPPAPGKGANASQTTTDQNGTQAIVITGTVSRQTQTASPVTVVNAANLQDRGITTVADAVQQLTANNAGADPGSWSAWGFAAGASAPSLRGFNDAYTVTLFDGLRSALYPLADDGFRNFVDINTIPESIVDRIEVLQDGASANYGADAVAGVVNVIIKKEIQGVHANASYGISEKGDARERRADLTLGFGSLADRGFNIYINGEFQKNDPLYLGQRGYPFNTSDQSKVCTTSLFDGSQECGVNGIRNGIQWNGDYTGFVSTTVPFVIPYTAPGVIDTTLDPTSQYQLLNPSAGCQNLTPYTLTPAQQAHVPIAPAVVCQQDNANLYQQYNSRLVRNGLNARGTFNLTPDIQAYLMANWYHVRTDSNITPLSFTFGTAAGGTTVTPARIYLPAYVCPEAQPVLSSLVSSIITFTGCDATNGVLNPNNPFATAAHPDLARLLGQYDRPRSISTNANTYRLSSGVSGSVGGFSFDVEGTASSVSLDTTSRNFIQMRDLLQAIGQGTYNFVDQSANTEAQRQLIAPTAGSHSLSKLAEIQGTVGRDVAQLGGGPLNIAVGAAYRYESIANPSGNPPNEQDPTDRYYSLNAVSASGSRHVVSGYYSVDVPAFQHFDFKAEGRYDKYSAFDGAFSPKFELQYQPVQQIKLRGTYSKGFRIPSFNESDTKGVPTTGYVTANVDCSKYVSFCASHAGTGYLTVPYVYGLSSVGSGSLKPERSESYTFGTVLEPVRQLTFTLDYWHTRIKDIIIPATSSQAIFDQYYLNNGVVNIPGVTVIPGVADPGAPNALATIGFIQSPYRNADVEVGAGIDFSATGRFRLTDSGIRLISSLSTSYLQKLELTDPVNGKAVYAGTLSPCAITSCSGAPRWRGQWQNTLDFGGRASLTGTVYYTSGYSAASTDYGAPLNDCIGDAPFMTGLLYPDQAPQQCKTKATWDFDLTGQVKVLDSVTIYGNVLNVFNTKPPYDPNAGYGLYQFNPAWADKNFIGRYFRIGARFDLNPHPRVTPVAVEAPPPPPPPPAPPATITCPDGLVILANEQCPVPPPPPPPPAPTPERGW